MPQLLLLLGKKVDLHMTLSYLPRHNFIKFTDEQNHTWNLEATSGGGYVRDSHYIEQFQMSNKAIETGAYMATLTDDETIASMAHFIPEWLMHHDKPEEAIAAYSVLIQHNPKDVYAWIGRGSSFALMLRRDITSKYTSLRQMTLEQKQYADRLLEANKQDFEQAEALGWTENDDLKSAIASKQLAEQAQQ